MKIIAAPDGMNLSESEAEYAKHRHTLFVLLS